MDNIPTSYPDPIPIAIIGGTGLSSLPNPPFTPVALIPPFQTPWGLPSSPIAILTYTPPSPTTATTTTKTTPSTQPKPVTVAFLARHGLHHQLAPHELPYRANVAALKKLGVRVAVGFSAVGSLREEVKPRDFVVAGGVVDWTKGVRPWTFFDAGIVGHISLSSPFDPPLSHLLHRALQPPGILAGENITVHSNKTLICIEGPQFSTRSESLLYRSLPTSPPISIINMSAVPECKLFREAEIAYGLVCMSTDYDSWKDEEEGEGHVSVEMVMGHMGANAGNAKRAVVAVLEAISEEAEGKEMGEGVLGDRWRGKSRGGVMGLSGREGAGKEAVERLRWLFGEEWVRGENI